MSGFGDQISARVATYKARLQRLKEALPEAARSSIVDGSAITNAPGQPGESWRARSHRANPGVSLKESWLVERDAAKARVISQHPAARMIEDGVRHGRAIRYEHGGGPHSVKLTKAGLQSLVNAVARQVVSGG